jgi:hypothetical protein
LASIIVVSLTLVLSSLGALLLVRLICLGFFLIIAEIATGSVGLAIFVAATLGRVVLLRVLT